MHHDMSDYQAVTVSLKLHEIEERMHNLVGVLDHYLGEMRAAQAVAQSTYFDFFFMEGGFTREIWRDFQTDAKNKDAIEYRSGPKEQFYFMDSHKQEAMPIESCKVIDSIGGDTWKVKFRVRSPITDLITDKNGVMTEHQFKNLCIFVISKSNSTDFLGDFIANGVKPNTYR
jgi:hypothetical protein